MDKGIRPFVNAKFLELAPTRPGSSATNGPATREGNTLFRKNVMFAAMEAFGISVASAATHYNHAFIECKKVNPALVEGLGRPEDKKGGRKPKPKAEAVVATPTLLLGYTAPEGTATETVAAEAAAETVPPVGGETSDAGETAAAQTLFTVKKKADDSVVAENLSFEDATALVNKAAAAKKAKLYAI